MCSIFGKENPTRSELNDLADLNTKRGNQAFGGLSLSYNQEIIFRYFSPYNPELFIPGGDFVLCHSLASTGTAKRIHPFETDRFILAHNGILLNYEKFNMWRIGPVDSQYLVGGIQFKVNNGSNVIDAIIEVNEMLQGQRACWLWDRFDRVAYFWRVMSPLFYSLNPFAFSSTGFENSEQLEEGYIYSYKNSYFSKLEKFKFYSPYLT